MDDCGGTGVRLDALLTQDSVKWSDRGKLSGPQRKTVFTHSVCCESVGHCKDLFLRLLF